MFKELWILMMLLFRSRPSDRLDKDLELMVMTHFPFKRFTFMCWCGKVILREEKRPLIERFLQTKAGKDSITHEGGHVKQAIDEHGNNWSRYYLNYFWNWLKHCPWVAPSSSCYYLNRYECQAFAQECNPDYWKNNTRKDLKGKYTIKDAKRKWKELGGTAAAWKRYVKSL